MCLLYGKMFGIYINKSRSMAKTCSIWKVSWDYLCFELVLYKKRLIDWLIDWLIDLGVTANPNSLVSACEEVQYLIAGWQSLLKPRVFCGRDFFDCWAKASKQYDVAVIILQVCGDWVTDRKEILCGSVGSESILVGVQAGSFWYAVFDMLHNQFLKELYQVGVRGWYIIMMSLLSLKYWTLFKEVRRSDSTKTTVIFTSEITKTVWSLAGKGGPTTVHCSNKGADSENVLSGPLNVNTSLIIHNVLKSKDFHSRVTLWCQVFDI